MAELREVFDVVTKQIEPDLGAWKEQALRQRRSARSRKMRAMAVAAAVTVGAALFAARVLDRGGEGSAPASVVPTAPGVTLTVVDLDGTIRSTIPDLPDGAAMPDISPDGTRVAFTVFDDRTSTSAAQVSQIAVLNLDGTGTQILTDSKKSSVEWPRWSADGTRLLFYRVLSYRSQQVNGQGYRRLMTMSADGSDARVILGTRTPDGQPASQSPDGSLIVYTSVAGGAQHLESLPTTGGRSRQLTNSRREEGGGVWSPDGRFIAFVRQVNVGIDAPAGVSHQPMDQIWLMHADGSDRHLLAALPDAQAEAPEWSPDGTKVAFIGSMFGIGGAESDSDAVFVVNVSTGEITQVLQGIAIGSEHDSHATWLPGGDAVLVMTRTS